MVDNFSTDTRDPNRSRPRVESEEPTAKIDKPDKVNILSYPLDRPKYYMTFGFQEYRRPNMFDGLRTDGVQDYISLPMPARLVDSSELNYSQEDGSFIVDASMSTLQGNMDAYKTGGIDALEKGLGDTFKQLGMASTGAGIRGAYQLGAGLTSLSPNLFQAAGLADNPFRTALFKGVSFKTHIFDWRLSPRSPAENNEIQKIVNTFKKAAHPEMLNATFGGFYKYPMIVQPKFNPVATADSLYRFKPCVITNVTADWASDRGPTFYYDGKPIDVVLSISLMEIELWRNGAGSGGFLDATVGNGDFKDVTTPPVRNLGPV
jgi:hypothetical protein